MLIQVNPGDIEASPAVHTFIDEQLNQALKHIVDHVTRVEVHLHDDTAGKVNQDRRVTMEGRLRGMQPIAVEFADHDLYQAIRGAAGKLERALKHKIERAHPAGDERR